MSVKNLVVSPSQLGRISIGRVVEKNGKNIPEKCDNIRVTGNAMVNKTWVDHPVMASITPDATGKIRSIPVRVLFDAPDNNLQTSYSCFDTKGRQVCVGDGAVAKRREGGAMTEVVCPGPELCPFGQQNRCKLYSRLTIGIDVDAEGYGYESNPTAGFVFRSTGWNSAKQLQAQLAMFSAACGGKMAGFPADLVIRAKSSSMSMKSMFYYLDLVPKGSLVSAVMGTLARRKQMDESGVTWERVEEAVASGLAQSAFAEDGEDGQSIVQEFFGDGDAVDTATGEVLSPAPVVEPVLSEAETDLIKAGLAKAGRSITSLNTWLGRPEDAPLSTMGEAAFMKVKAALGLKDQSVAAAA